MVPTGMENGRIDAGPMILGPLVRLPRACFTGSWYRVCLRLVCPGGPGTVGSSANVASPITWQCIFHDYANLCGCFQSIGTHERVH